MLPIELRDLLATLGLTQVGAARLLGVDVRTVRRWVLGERDIPPPAIRFLQYIQAVGASPDAVMTALETQGQNSDVSK